MRTPMTTVMKTMMVIWVMIIRMIMMIMLMMMEINGGARAVDENKVVVLSMKRITKNSNITSPPPFFVPFHRALV